MMAISIQKLCKQKGNLMRQLDWSLFAERGSERKPWVLGSPGRSTVPAIVERAGPTGKELETAAFASVVGPHEGTVVSAEDL